MATNSSMSRRLPEQLLGGIQRLVALGVRRVQERLLAPQAEDAEAPEAREDEAMHAILQLAREIDHHVAAEDEVELVEGAVGDEVVLREQDLLLERLAEDGVVVVGGVVVAERRLPAGAQVAL